MPEELQHLLERIQKDGVQKAEAEAEQIVGAAKVKASTMVKEAEEKAAVITKEAEARASQFAQSGERSLQQGARDIVLGIGETLTQLLQDIILEEVSGALTGEAFRDIVVHAVQAYCKTPEAQSGMEILLSPGQQKDVADYVLSRLQDKMKEGVEVKSDESIVAGFAVSMKKNGLQHDFTPEAIADSLASVVRPRLAEIVKKAVDQGS